MQVPLARGLDLISPQGSGSGSGILLLGTAGPPETWEWNEMACRSVVFVRQLCPAGSVDLEDNANVEICLL